MPSVPATINGTMLIVSASVWVRSFRGSLAGTAGNGLPGSFTEQRHWSPHLQGTLDCLSFAEQHVVLAEPQHDFNDAFAAQQLVVAVSDTLPARQPQLCPFNPNGCKNSIAMADHANSCFMKTSVGICESTVIRFLPE